MVVITAVISIMAEGIESYIDQLDGLAKESVAKESGCLHYLVHHNIARRGVILLYEVYQDEQAHRDHLESEHFQQFHIKTAKWIESKTVERWFRET